MRAPHALYEQAIQSDATPGGETQEENTTPEDNRHMLGLALMQQGMAQQELGRSGAAITLYERALSVVEQQNDQINYGSILHQIGNCAADLGESERAFISYIAAAKQFHSIAMAEYLSNAISEAGYVVVNWSPLFPLDSFISNEILADALSDVAVQISRFFAPECPTFQFHAGGMIIRKAFGMTAFVSFCSEKALLAKWASELREDVLRPLLDESMRRNRSEGDRILLRYLDLTLSLAASVSEAMQPNGSEGQVPMLAEIEYYSRLCYRYYDSGWEAFRPFQWLSTYLRRQRGVQGIDAAKLLYSARASEERSEPFVLPDVGLDQNDESGRPG